MSQTQRQLRLVAIIGTAPKLADGSAQGFLAGAADGLSMRGDTPTARDDVVGQVIPLLQQRRFYRSEYAGVTLRETPGLTTPDNSFAQQCRQQVA